MRIDIHSHAYQQARAKLLKDATHCTWCGKPISDKLPVGHPNKAEFDHYPPRAAVGDHLNGVPACHPCQAGHVSMKAYRASQHYVGPSMRW